MLFNALVLASNPYHSIEPDQKIGKYKQKKIEQKAPKIG
jgi:hypothetical protein